MNNNTKTPAFKDVVDQSGRTTEAPECSGELDDTTTKIPALELDDSTISADEKQNGYDPYDSSSK